MRKIAYAKTVLMDVGVARFSYHPLPDGAGYRAVWQCWELKSGERPWLSEENRCTVLLEITIPQHTLPWIDVFQPFALQWGACGVVHLALDVPTGMYNQMSCLHIHQLLEDAPRLERLTPAEDLAQSVGSCSEWDHGGQVDHAALIAALELLMVGEYGSFM